MGDRREVAAETLQRALKVITTERGNQHGDAENSFDMIANLWRVYLENTNYMAGNHISVVIRPVDVAEMMSLLKKARKVHGMRSDPDHSVDDVGYTALAEMLSTPQPAAQPPQHFANKLDEEMRRQNVMASNTSKEIREVKG